MSQKQKRLTEIQDTIRVTSSEKYQVESKLSPIIQQLNEALNKKELTRQKNRKILEDAQSSLNKVKNLNSEIRKLNTLINDLIEQDISGQIKHIKSLLENYKSERIKYENDIETTAKKIENLKEEITLQEINQRDLEDNRELKRILELRIEIQGKYDQLKNSTGDQELKTLVREKEQLLNQQDVMNEKRSRHMGQINELQVSK